MKFLLTSISLLFLLGSLRGQTQLDSLRQQYEQAVDGSRDEAAKFLDFVKYLYESDHPEALAFAEELIKKAASVRDTALLLTSYNLEGTILTRKGQLDSAALVFAKALSTGEIFGDTSLLILLHRDLSSVHYFKGDMKNAFKELMLAANLLQDCPKCPPARRAIIYDDLAWYYHFASNDADKALYWAYKTMNTSKGQNIQNEAASNLRLCEIYLKAGNLDSATQYCPVALEMAEKNDFKVLMAFAKVYNTRLTLLEGRTEQALSLGLDAIQTNEGFGTGYASTIIAAYNAVAEVYMEMGDTHKALALLQRLPVKVEDSDFSALIELKVYHRLLAQLLEDTDPAKALVHYQRASGIQDTLQQEMYNISLAGIEVESKLAEKALENQRLQFEKEKQAGRAKNFQTALFATVGILFLLSLAAFYIYKTAQKNKRLADELANSNQQLATANADLELFSYSLAHDIQSYVTQALNYTFFLDEKPGALPPEKEQDFMQKARRSIKGLSTFCRDLIAYARMGQDASEPEEVDLNEVLGEVRSALQSQVEEAGVALSVPDNLPEVIAHRPRMVQLYQNLVGNAIKYRRAGVVTEVKVAFEQKGSDYFFTVSDNGQGIPAERISRLFDLFVKGDMGGSGIGLAVCRRIVEGYGGRIWVESEVGVGSRFCFIMPA
ncbi:MAG: ATP-binding protein [Saprospiraceae bacterium]